jgi:formate dehydrogenase maturation protein FdhE
VVSLNPTSVNLWEKRVLRARFLAGGFPVSREILTFYASLVEWQGSVAPRLTAFKNVAAAIPSLLDLVSRTAPAPLARAAREFHQPELESWLRLHWESPGDPSPQEFFARAALQPYAASLPEGLDCPWCSGPPQAGCLHPQGDGLAFELVCALCQRRRGFPRARCPGCNEASESKIASFSTTQFPHLRLLACETCKGYLVIVDLDKDIAAIPEVDELVALPLDLWAVEQGYIKLHPNIAGV